MAGFFNTGDANDPSTTTPGAIDRRRRLAEALMAQGSSTAPIGHWTQGLARLAQAGVGSYQLSQLDKQEAAGRKSAQTQTSALLRALMGDTSSGFATGVAPGGPSGAPVAPSQAMTTGDATGARRGSGGVGGFDSSMARVFEFEGGLNPSDTNGTPSNFGINQKANPDVDVAGLTRDTAKPLYKSRYWDTIGADKLPPALAHVAFDTSVIAGPGKAQELLAASGGDPMKFLELRKQFQDDLIARDPGKYGPYAKAWGNRLDTLRADIASGGGQPQPTQLASAGGPMAYAPQGQGSPSPQALAAAISGGSPASPAPPSRQALVAALGGAPAAPGPTSRNPAQGSPAALGALATPGMPMANGGPRYGNVSSGASAPAADVPRPAGSIANPADGQMLAQANPVSAPPRLTGLQGGAGSMPTQPNPVQQPPIGQAAMQPPQGQAQPAGDQRALAAAMQLVNSEWATPGQKQIAAMIIQRQMTPPQTSTVDLGDRIALMSRGQVTGYLPKTRDSADWQPVTDGNGNTIGRFNKRTGQSEPLANPLGGARKAPRVEKFKTQDGSEVSVQWDEAQGVWVPLNAPDGGRAVQDPKFGKLTEGQSKDVGFYQRGLEANKSLTPEAEKALTSAADTALQNFPSMMGINPARAIQAPEFQTAHNAARNFLAVVLRKDTGAAITSDEWTEYTPMFIPQPNDTPALLDQKRKNRSVALQAIKDGLGNVGDVLERVMAARNGAAGAQATPGAGASGQPVRVSTPDEAKRLPSGTKIILPDGRQGVVP